MGATNKKTGLVSQSEMEQGSGSSPRLPSTKRYRGINYAAEDKNTLYEYGQGNVQGEPAAILPIVDQFGDTPGAENPYGLVVTGSSFVGPSMKQVDMNTAELERVMTNKKPQELDEDELSKELEGLEKTIREDAPAPSMDSLMAEAGIVDTTTTDGAPPVTDSITVPLPINAPEPKYEYQMPGPVYNAVEESPQIPTVRATLSSALGDFQGNYLACVVTDVCVVMITTLTENILTPKPSAENILEITVDDETYEVFYYAQTFEYDDKRYQIYVRK